MNEIEFDLSRKDEAERLAEFCKALLYYGAKFSSTRRDSYVIITVKV